MARYFIGLKMPEVAGTWLPWGTLTVNVVGSLIIGIVGALALEHGVFSTGQRVLLITGIIGGFTTFSAFSLDTRILFRDGDAGQGVVYVALSVGVCLVAVWAGWTVGRSLG